MGTNRSHGVRRSRGMVLITSLLILLVVTLLALAMFHGVGLEYRIAGNNMDKQRSLQAAESAQEYGEQWLVANVPQDYGAAEVWGIPCAAANFGSSLTSPLMCSNTLESTLSGGNVGSVPWGGSGGSLGFSYNPGSALSMTAGTSTMVASYPVVYLSRLGYDLGTPNSLDFVIDAWSYGGSANTVSVVESVYRVTYIASPPGP
jgi:type IV pilus assembly protein PilX